MGGAGSAERQSSRREGVRPVQLDQYAARRADEAIGHAARGREETGRPRFGRGPAVRWSQMWFLTCCALLGAIGVEAGLGRPEDKTPTVHAFNCDRPSVVKQYDAVGRCARTIPAFEPEGRPTEYTQS